MEDFVPFETAKKLKEKGFKTENTDWCYLDGNLVQVKKYVNISPYEYAPTISQVLKWFRKEKKIYVSVEVEREDWFEYKIVQTIKNARCNSTRVYETYDDAMLAGIEYCLDNLI